jgi:hypothetical protein
MQILKEGGDYAKKQIKHRRRISIPILIIGVILFFSSFYLPSLALLAWFGIVIVLCGIGYAISPAWKSGIKGEKIVRDTLCELDDSYYLINDVVLFPKQGNIDHIVLGPNGIFSIETKNYSGKVRCNKDSWEKLGKKRRKYPIKSVSQQAKRNASTLKTFIKKYGGDTFKDHSISIKPVVVFTYPYVKLYLRHPTVPVKRPRELCNFIKQNEEIFFSDQELKTLGEIILKYSI